MVRPAANSFWLKIVKKYPYAIYFTDRLEKNNAEKCQPTELNVLQPNFFKVPNLTYSAFWNNASWQSFRCSGGIQRWTKQREETDEWLALMQGKCQRTCKGGLEWRRVVGSAVQVLCVSLVSRLGCRPSLSCYIRTQAGNWPIRRSSATTNQQWRWCTDYQSTIHR